MHLPTCFHFDCVNRPQRAATVRFATMFRISPPVASHSAQSLFRVARLRVPCQQEHYLSAKRPMHRRYNTPFDASCVRYSALVLMLCVSSSNDVVTYLNHDSQGCSMPFDLGKPPTACGVCSMVYYCSSACQKRHAPLHDRSCRVLAESDIICEAARYNFTPHLPSPLPF